MKKWIGYLTVFTTIAAVLGGCGSQSKAEAKLDPDNPTEITVWHYYNGVQQQQFSNLVKEFNSTVGAEEGIIVSEYSQGSVDDLSKKLQDSIDEKAGSDACPDIFSAYSDTAYSLSQTDKLVNFKDYFTDEELAEYVGAYIDEGMFDKDSLQLFPIAKSTEVFALNTTDWDKFASETGADKADLATWEGIAKTAKSYYEWSGGKAFFGRDATANYMFVGAQQLGKAIYTVDEEGQVTYQLDEEIMRKLWDNYYIPYINGYFASEGKFRSDDAKTGTVISYVGSSSSISYFPTEVTLEDGTTYPIDSEIYAVPNFEGTDNLAVQQGAGMAVLKSDKQKEFACCEFLKWFTDKEQNVEFSLTSGYLPVKQDADSLAKETLEQDKEITGLTKESLKVGLDMMSTYDYCKMPAFDKAYDVRSAVGYGMDDKAKEDKAAIAELENQGISHEEAVAQYDTDENFQAWFTALKDKIEALK